MDADPARASCGRRSTESITALCNFDSNGSIVVGCAGEVRRERHAQRVNPLRPLLDLDLQTRCKEWLPCIRSPCLQHSAPLRPVFVAVLHVDLQGNGHAPLKKTI